MPGMKGMTGPQGSIHIIQLSKVCQEKGGKYYGGVCLMESTLTTNRDNYPAGCSAYQPYMYWSHQDYININKLFRGNKHSTEHVRGWGNGGLCTNYGAILAYTNWHSNNHVWARYGVFHWNAHHQYTGWHCHWWWWSCWRYHYQHCHIYNGAGTSAIYACRL